MENDMAGTASPEIGRTIDEIWHEEVAALEAETPEKKGPPTDFELERLANELQCEGDALSTSRDNSDAEAHYAAAINSCRLTRRIRFHIRSPKSLPVDTRNHLLNVMNSVAGQIHVEFDKVITKGLHEKTLEKVKQNILHRVNWLLEDTDA